MTCDVDSKKKKDRITWRKNGPDGTYNCPKCGFERKNDATECPRCGIVFEKFESLKPIDRKETLCRCKFLRVEQGEFSRLLKPVVIAKEYVEALYGKILELIWNELVKGEDPLDNMSNLGGVLRLLRSFRCCSIISGISTAPFCFCW